MERRIYRIIDADFNRAREALRTIEEFCRFVLDDPALSARAKQMRHHLCAQITAWTPKNFSSIATAKPMSDAPCRSNPHSSAAA